MTNDTPEMPRKLSYSQRMIAHLEKNDVGFEAIEAAKEFARFEAILIKAEREASRGLMTFGKYAGKKLHDIHKLDAKYIKWLDKNRKYLNSENREIVDELLLLG